MGGALGEMINTPVKMVDTPVKMVDTPINLVETLVDLVKPLVGVRLELAETLVDPPFHTMQGRQRYCCQSNAYREDANKN